MTLYKNTYRVESSRLKDWDYSNDAAYFVTICVYDMKNYFGKVIKESVELSCIGKIIDEEWLQTGKMRPNVFLDEYKIMPNHFHGIIMILNDLTVETNRVRLNKRVNDNNSRDALSASQNSSGDARRAESENITVEMTWQVVSNRETNKGNAVETHGMRLMDEGNKHAGDARRASLQNIIKGFKSKCTSRIHALGHNNFRWQSRYHDRIIRNEKELFNVRQYIMNNPIKWTFDEYYRDES